MPHSVEQHLHLRTSEYDRIIRTFIPRYDEMLATIVRFVGVVVPEGGIVIDLGGGTGSLADAIVSQHPRVRVEIRDVDPKMLEVASARLSVFGDRVTLVERSFDEPLPPCDAVVASIALHHVKEIEKKTSIYRNIHSALRLSGIFLNGDATMSTDPAVRDETYRLWGEFMKSTGMTDEEVKHHFAAWAGEDRYFALHEELDALRRAGFHEPECFWKFGPMTIVGGRK